MTVRIAWIRIAIEPDDEQAAQMFLTIMTKAVDTVAPEVAKKLGNVRIIEPVEAGQSFAIRDTEPSDRDDV